MNAGPDLISLLYRADWTQLNLSAVTNHGTSILVAPGRRYRVETADYLTGCAGDRPWRLAAEHAEDAEDPDGDTHWVSGPEPPLPDLLCPAWLLISSHVELRGAVRVCGRDAFRVEATRRKGRDGHRVPARFRAGRAEVLVDAELGILLRMAWLADGVEPEVTELVSLDLDPVIDPALFAPPPGSLVAESMGDAMRAGGPRWTLLKTVAGVAAGGLGAWTRYAPSAQRDAEEQAGDDDAAISPDGPAPERSADGRPVGPPVTAEVLGLLHDSTPGGFTATVHDWTDLGAMLSQVPDGARRAGFGGLGLLIDAISERPAASHLSYVFQIDGAGRYRIDYPGREDRRPVMVACDGERCWQVYQDRVTVGPAGAPPTGIAELLDPSWLLGCGLSGGTPVSAGDRQAYRINVARGAANSSLSLPSLFPAAVAVVDAGTGLVLRLTSYIGDRPVRRCELRDITPMAGELTIDIPPGLPVTEETGPGGDARPPGGPYRVGFPWKAAGAAAGQAATDVAKGVAKGVAKETAKAAGDFLRRLTDR
jgi:hypothetical protein